jgi:branched-subunit amino acid aminotransferase/4-amino-4-deoxychorismate lyase
MSMPLLVADSFLLDDGRVRGLELHRSRFGNSCARHGVRVEYFWTKSVAAFPQQGRWFPRFELGADRELRLRMRPAPRLGTDVSVRVYDGPDPRREPRIKGPDLDLLGELRESADADDVLLCGAGGLVLEAAYASLLWWEGEVLCLPPQGLRVLPSVTVALLRRIAAERGVAVAERARRPADLDGAEAWLVNALHGIRPVRAWAGSALVAGVPARAAAWRDALTRTAAAPTAGR